MPRRWSKADTSRVALGSAAAVWPRPGSRRLLIAGGTVINADRKFEADVYCEDGVIK